MDAVANSRDRRTETLWMGGFVRQFGGIEEPALRKLYMLHQARDLTDYAPGREPTQSAFGRSPRPSLDPDQQSMA